MVVGRWRPPERRRRELRHERRQISQAVMAVRTPGAAVKMNDRWLGAAADRAYANGFEVRLLRNDLFIPFRWQKAHKDMGLILVER
jgi:hypothetical protein